MSEYGEPWDVQQDATSKVFHLGCKDNELTKGYGLFLDGRRAVILCNRNRELMDRVAACVNAMRYVTDPEKFMGHIRSAIREQHSIGGISEHIAKATECGDFEVYT